MNGIFRSDLYETKMYARKIFSVFLFFYFHKNGSNRKCVLFICYEVHMSDPYKECRYGIAEQKIIN